MIEVKYNLCDEVYFFNTATCKVDKVEIKSVRIIPTAVSKDENGRNILDSYVVLYETVQNLVLSEPEVFATEEECKSHYLEALNQL